MSRITFVAGAPLSGADLETAFVIVETMAVVGEDLTSQANGTRTLFTLANNFRANSTAVYVNGVRQRRGTDYTETAPNKITFTSAPASAAVILVDYQKS